jgi:two-component sensor histidine kinase
MTITAAYFGALIGLLLFNLFTHIQIAARTGWARRELALLIGTFVILVYDIACLAEYRTDSIDRYFALIKLQAVCGGIFFISLIEFVMDLASRKPRLPVRILEASFVAIAVFRLLLPYSGAYSAIHGMAEMELPWGETVHLVEGDSNLLYPIYIAAILAALAVCAEALFRKRREGDKREAGYILAALGILLPAMIFDALVAMGTFRWLYMSETVYVALTIAASLEVTDEVIRFSELRKELQLSLDGKNILIKEIHHRVKNNLSIIISLLRLQADEEADVVAKEKLSIAMNRIYALARIHEFAYSGDDVASIDLSKSIDDITKSVVFSLEAPNVKVKGGEIPKNVFVSIDQAVPIGLIANEIVTRLSRMRSVEGATITIFHEESIEEEGRRLRITIGAEGTQKPPEGLERGKGLGIELIEAIAKQIRATIRYDEGGRICRILVPLEGKSKHE